MHSDLKGKKKNHKKHLQTFQQMEFLLSNTLLYNVTFDAERQRKLIFKTFTKYNFPFFVPLALVHPQMLDYFR